MRLFRSIDVNNPEVCWCDTAHPSAIWQPHHPSQHGGPPSSCGYSSEWESRAPSQQQHGSPLLPICGCSSDWQSQPPCGQPLASQPPLRGRASLLCPCAQGARAVPPEADPGGHALGQRRRRRRQPASALWGRVDPRPQGRSQVRALPPPPPPNPAVALPQLPCPPPGMPAAGASLSVPKQHGLPALLTSLPSSLPSPPAPCARLSQGRAAGPEHSVRGGGARPAHIQPDNRHRHPGALPWPTAAAVPMDNPYCSCKLRKLTNRHRQTGQKRCCNRCLLDLQHLISLVPHMFNLTIATDIQICHGLQLHSLWTIPTAAVSYAS